MLKPNDYDSVQAYGEFEALDLGGHILQIMKVEESTSKSGNPMVVVSLDTAAGDSQPGYFKRKWSADTRQNKKWGCVVYVPVYDKNGGTSWKFKTFCVDVEKSNPGFQVRWGDGFAECFKGRLIGGVFGRQEFIGNDGKSHWNTKCFNFRTVEDIKEGVEVPEDRYLERQTVAAPEARYDTAPIMDDGEPLPF